MTVMEIMLSAIRTQVCGEARVEYGALSSEVMRALYSLSKSHDMAHLVAAELEAQGLLQGDDQTVAEFRKQQMLAVYRYERIQFELVRIDAALEAAEIDFVPLKGSVIREYYPEPWMRTSCDIDVLVRLDDLDKATASLKDALGYTIGRQGSHDVSLFAPSGVHVELHYDLIEGGKLHRCYTVLENPMTLATSLLEGSCHRAFSDEYFYFYHVAHMAKHFEIGGCGIRPFLDLWILEHRIPHDDEKRKELLAEGGLARFADAAKRLSQAWFGNEAYDDITRSMEQYVLGGGVYGTMENRVAVQQTKKGGKLRYAWSRIWLPYDVLKFHYPVLQKHRGLFPVMQVRRWGKLVFCGGLKRSANELYTVANISAECQQDMSAMFEELGL